MKIAVEINECYPLEIEWTACADHNPIRSGWYLTTDINAPVYTVKSSYYDVHVERSKSWSDQSVTHWIPMIASPKKIKDIMEGMYDNGY